MNKENNLKGVVSCQQQIPSQYQLTIPCLKTHSPYIKALNQTLQKFDNYSSLTSPLCSTARKSNRISIIPLNKQKIRVNFRSRNRHETKIGFESFKSTNVSPQKNRYESATHKSIFQYFSMLSFMYNKYHRKSYKLEVFIDQLLVYCKSHKERQLIREIYHITSISSNIRKFLINNENGEFKYNTIKYCQGELSKLFFNICYEIYLYKNNKQEYNILDNIHKDIQYYSRRLKMLNLTISCCMDMGKINCDYFEFSKACIQYNKALKLAVYLGDKYMQELAIDRLGMCQYYRGDIISANYFHSSVDRLSAYDKTKIKQTYSNQYEIKKILQQKTKQISEEDEIRQQFFNINNKENAQINFDCRSKDKQYIQNNYLSFRNELKEIIKIKDLKKKVPLIKHVMEKNAKIGNKKYCGKIYFVPKASKFHNKNYEQSSQQFLISHKSYNRNNVGCETLRLDKHCKIIDQILNFILSEFKSSKYLSIKEERQSLYEEEAQ